MSQKIITHNKNLKPEERRAGRERTIESDTDKSEDDKSTVLSPRLLAARNQNQRMIYLKIIINQQLQVYIL